MVRDSPDLSDRRMFGGVAFLLGGNMAVVVSGAGGLMVRVDPDEGDRLVDDGPAVRAIMRGREMRGWLRVASDDLAEDVELQRWVDQGLRRAGELDPKERSAIRSAIG